MAAEWLEWLLHGTLATSAAIVLVLGFLAVQGLNVVRVISLFYLGQWNTQVFNFAHEYLWQALIMLDVLIVWLLWIRAGNKAAAAPASPDAATAV